MWVSVPGHACVCVCACFGMYAGVCALACVCVCVCVILLTVFRGRWVGCAGEFAELRRLKLLPDRVQQLVQRRLHRRLQVTGVDCLGSKVKGERGSDENSDINERTWFNSLKCRNKKC